MIFVSGALVQLFTFNQIPQILDVNRVKSHRGILTAM